MLMSAPDQLSPREAEQMRYDAEREDKQMAYGMKMKELDIEVDKLQARWQAWFQIPILLLKLPLKLVILPFMGIAYIVHVFKGNAPTEDFWNLLK